MRDRKALILFDTCDAGSVIATGLHMPDASACDWFF